MYNVIYAYIQAQSWGKKMEANLPQHCKDIILLYQWIYTRSSGNIATQNHIPFPALTVVMKSKSVPCPPYTYCIQSY